VKLPKSRIAPRTAGSRPARLLAGCLPPACLLLALVATAAAQDVRPTGPLRFDSELIRISVEGDTLRVEGLYRFAVRDSSRRAMPILYPYPVDSLLGDAWTELLECRAPGEDWETADFRELPGCRGARWLLSPADHDTLEVRTVYRQLLHARYGRYIVTTTAGWQEPLRRARFEIRLPAGTRPSSFSHPFLRRETGDDVLYVLEEVDFLPDRDIVFTWNDITGLR
jgi:hypothetical protein